MVAYRVAQTDNSMAVFLRVPRFVAGLLPQQAADAHPTRSHVAGRTDGVLKCNVQSHKPNVRSPMSVTTLMPLVTVSPSVYKYMGEGCAHLPEGVWRQRYYFRPGGWSVLTAIIEIMAEAITITL